MDWLSDEQLAEVNRIHVRWRGAKTHPEYLTGIRGKLKYTVADVAWLVWTLGDRAKVKFGALSCHRARPVAHRRLSESACELVLSCITLKLELRTLFMMQVSITCCSCSYPIDGCMI